MEEFFRDCFIKIKSHLVLAIAGISGLILAAGFWGIAFPHYMFMKDSVKIFDEAGEDITEEAGKEKNLYVELGSAEPEQIKIKVGILEWAER